MHEIQEGNIVSAIDSEREQACGIRVRGHIIGHARNTM
eukprot:COSAG05_NODE_155_length_15704_cov_84.777315_15_plen_38_part_00